MKTIVYILLSILYCKIIAQEINCSVKIKLIDKIDFKFLYINDGSEYYYCDSIGKDLDSVRLCIDEPKHATLFINNDAEHVFQFYLDEGIYDLNIDCKVKTATIIGSPLNDEYKEMMRVNDSMFKEYKIMHAILYPYNGMDRDSAHAWLQKYLPLCNELSDKHVAQFYETHLSSFLTLEHIFVQLQYTFDNPGFDSTEVDLKQLKILFDKLDPSLKKYSMYHECAEMFSKERVKLQEINKPLFNYEFKPD